MQRKKIVVPAGSNISYLPNLSGIDNKNPVAIWMSWAIAALVILSIVFIYKYVNSQTFASEEKSAKNDTIAQLSKELNYIHQLKKGANKPKHKRFELRYLGNAKSMDLDYTVLGLTYNTETGWTQSSSSGRYRFTSGSSPTKDGDIKNMIPLYIALCATETRDSVTSKKCTIMPFNPNEDEWIFKIE